MSLLPVEGWKTLATAVLSIGTGVWLFYVQKEEAAMMFVLFGGALLGIGDKIDKLSREQRTNNEVAAKQVEVLTQQPAHEVLSEAKTAADAKPDPNGERQGRSSR